MKRRSTTRRAVGRSSSVQSGEEAVAILPGEVDPITLQPLEEPMMAPTGHVANLATWRSVLGRSARNPFTNQELKLDSLVELTNANVGEFRHQLRFG